MMTIDVAVELGMGGSLRKSDRGAADRSFSTRGDRGTESVPVHEGASAVPITDDPASPIATFRHDDAGTGASDWHSLVAAAPRVHFADLPLAGRTVVVAPHPDDESLGAGGLVAGLAAAGAEVDVVICSDGAAAQVALPDGVDDLADCRRDEVVSAVRVLTGGRVTPVLLELPDGRLAEHHGELVARLAPLLERADLVVGPWPDDGHPDHRAVGMATRVAARDTAAVLEYPIWFWHWADPAAVSDGEWVALPLSAAARRAKSAAIEQHRSQVAGSSPMLSPAFLEHFARGEELFLVHRSGLRHADRSSAEFFEAMYRASPDGDPWSFATDDREQARYDHLASIVGERRVRRCLEAGCSTGELTFRLAQRCERVLAFDVASTAVDVARSRVGDVEHVELRVGSIPDDLGPDDTDLDLIVLSEVAYYFGPDGLAGLVAGLHGRCSPDARWLLCHWTGTSTDHRLDGQRAHDLLGAELSARGWCPSTAETFGEHLVAVWQHCDTTGSPRAVP
jgi:LmbE family N-acetylglucosaminyl deacetylase/cyclopropane fatty-acyl-phospholipid synthase-like methyltransferase